MNKYIIFLLYFSLVSCVSELVRESAPADFPYNCSGEDPSNAHIAELARKIALKRDPRILSWTRPFCQIEKIGLEEDWIVRFIRYDTIPEDVVVLQGAEMVSVIISGRELRVKTVQSNVRYWDSMRKQVFFSFLLLILSFKSGIAEPSSKSIKADPEQIRGSAQGLTSIRPFRNYRNIPSLDKAADLVYSSFLKFGYSPTRQRFQVEKNRYQNIEARIGKGKKIVIGAHYDVAGDQEGADDNASGVAALLELARILKQIEDKLEYEIILVSYSLEEPPYFRTVNMGSFQHAKALAQKKEKIELMISLETIGYFSEEKDSQNYPLFFMKWIYPNTGNFIAAVGRKSDSNYLTRFKDACRKKGKLPCETLAAPESLEGIDFSDHLNYWKFDIPAIMITDTAFLRNKNYHEISDTIDTLDFNRIGQVVDCVLEFIIDDKY